MCVYKKEAHSHIVLFCVTWLAGWLSLCKASLDSGAVCVYIAAAATLPALDSLLPPSIFLDIYY